MSEKKNSNPWRMSDEELRVQRRKRLLWLTLPIALVVILAAAKPISAQILYLMGKSDYGHAQYDAAAHDFERLEFANVISSHIAYFDEGTALLKAGDLPAAEEKLWVALDLTPKRDRCAVSTNLMLALEWQGDLLVQNGSYADGKQLYVLASSVNADSLCPQDQQQQNEDRLQQKQDSADEQQQQQEEGQGQGGGGDPSPDPNGSGSPSPPPSDGSTPSPSDSGNGGESPTPDPSESGGGGESQSPTPSADPNQEKLDELDKQNNDAQNQDEYGRQPKPDDPMNW